VAVLSACATTQETSDRLKVRADRILASRLPVNVKKANPQVEVVDTAVLRDGKEAAVVVTLRNTGKSLLNDLPLAVAVKASGGDVLVNRGTSFRYFETHTPALPPKRETTWVFTLPAKKLPAGTPVVKVGLPAASQPTAADSLPELQVSPDSSKADESGAIKTTIGNDGDFPQYDLAIYAWAKKDGRFVAAGQKSIGNLGTGKTAEIKLALVGDPGKSEVHVSAPPTIFE
jgi:hypothetical protein